MAGKLFNAVPIIPQESKTQDGSTLSLTYLANLINTLNWLGKILYLVYDSEKGVSKVKEVIAELTIVPLGTATTSLSRYVSACHSILKEAKDVNYELTAMGTIVQAPLKRVLELVQKMHEVPFSMGAKRVSTTIRIDDRRDKPATIESKVKAVI